MGYLVEKDEVFKKQCNSCKEKIEIIATGADLCCCPYCGFTLMDHRAEKKDIELSIDSVQKLIIQYRNTSNDFQKGTLKLELQNKLYWLINDLEFQKED
jgi:predicted RNA-binding Zn-ribbon protein involved in translation (DUF1610 family)